MLRRPLYSLMSMESEASVMRTFAFAVVVAYVCIGCCCMCLHSLLLRVFLRAHIFAYITFISSAVMPYVCM